MKNILFLAAGFYFLSMGIIYAQHSGKNINYKSGSVDFRSITDAVEKELLSSDAGNDTGKLARKLFNKKSLQYYRWKWYNQNRLDENGYTVNTLWRSIKALEEENKVNSFSVGRALPSGDWINLAPTSVFSLIPSAQQGVGRVNCIAFSSSTGEIFAGTAAGGVWKRIASGGTWTCITNSIPNLSISSICINPTNPNEIYILTGDGDGGDNSSIGVLKSVDGGISWFKTGLTWFNTVGERAYKMVMNPANSNNLLVASSSGIYATTDGGTTWPLKQSGVFFDIEFKPGAPATMYAAGINYLFTSSNTGDTWAPVVLPGLSSTSPSRCAVAVSSIAPNTVYFLAGTRSLPGFIGLWKSTGSGAAGSWGTGPISSGFSTNDVFIDGNGVRSQADYDMAFAINPTNANILYIGGIDVYRSANGGVTFNRESSYYQAGNDNMHPDIHALEHDGSGTMWVGNDGGVFRYDPGNLTAKWAQEYTGMITTQYFGLGLDRDANIFGNYEANYMGAQDNGEHRYDGDGNNEIVYFGDGGDAVVDYTNDNTYYFNGNGNLFKSCWPTPCDKTPDVSTCGCTDTTYNKNAAVAPDRPIVIDPSNHDIIYHGLSCLWRSTDGANSWALYPGFDCSVGGGITAVHVGSGYKWVAKQTKIFRETAANVWLDVTSNISPLPGGVGITDLAVNPSNPLEAWVSFGGYDPNYKVFYTLDGGGTWLYWGASIPNVPVLCLIYQNGTNGGLYAGTDIGVYYTNNTLPDFVPFKNGMPAVIVTDLDINPGQGLLYATTYGRGLWSSTLAGSCPVDDNTANFASLPGFSAVQASNSISSAQVFNNGYGQALEFVAGNSILLTPGFEIANGTSLAASIGGCTNVARPVSNVKDGYLVLDADLLAASVASQSDISGKNNLLQMELQPNPVSTQLFIQLETKEVSKVDIKILDLAGRQVMSIITNDELPAGIFRIPVTLNLLPAGAYLVRVQSGEDIRTKQLIKL